MDAFLALALLACSDTQVAPEVITSAQDIPKSAHVGDFIVIGNGIAPDAYVLKGVCLISGQRITIAAFWASRAAVILRHVWKYPWDIGHRPDVWLIARPDDPKCVDLVIIWEERPRFGVIRKGREVFLKITDRIDGPLSTIRRLTQLIR